jgi:hypothetical protein
MEPWCWRGQAGSTSRRHSGEHTCQFEAEGGTHGTRWCFRGGTAGRGCTRRRGPCGLHVAKESIAAAVIGRVAWAGVLAVDERLLVGGVGDEVGAPAILCEYDGEGVFQVGAVAEAAAVALPIVVDCRRGKQSASGYAGEAADRLTRNHVGCVDIGTVYLGNRRPSGDRLLCPGHAREQRGYGEACPAQGGSL